MSNERYISTHGTKINLDIFLHNTFLRGGESSLTKNKIICIINYSKISKYRGTC